MAPYTPEPMQRFSEDHQHHLSEDQLDELLMEIAEPAVAEHAAECALCGGRLAEFRAAMGEFNQASLAWSQARSNTLTRDLRGHRPSRTMGRTALWSYVSAGVVAAALLVTAGVEHHALAHQALRPQTAGLDYASSRQQEIATDNAMLAAISSEIDRPTGVASTLGEDGRQARNGALRQARN